MSHKSLEFGQLESRALFALEEAETAVVTSARLAGMLRISRGRANKLAWQLTKKGRLKRITRGMYLFAPMKAGPEGHWTEEALVLVSRLMEGRPYYVGFWTALNHYGFTEQIPRTTQVVTTAGRRSFGALGLRFEFIRVGRLGEWREESIAGQTVRFATAEQLIIDCLSHPGYCGGMREASKALWGARKTVNRAKLRALASRSNEAVRRRLGFLLEVLGLPGLDIARKDAVWRWLDPSAAKEVKGKSSKWGLLLNVTEKELTCWMES